MFNIIHIQQINKGESVGYDRSFIASKPITVATLPIGYADGYSILYANAQVTYNGTACPIIGKICMDLCMIDVSHIEGYQIGDTVNLLGSNPGETTANDLANLTNTISYQVLASIGQRVARIYTYPK